MSLVQYRPFLAALRGAHGSDRGGGTGNAFGGEVRASFGATFGDLLRDRQLQTFVRAGTDADDFAAQVAYTTRIGQWNWGATAGFMPARFYGARRSVTRDAERLTRETTSLRYLHQWGGVIARYNISRARRLELGVGVRRTGFAWQTITRVLDAERNTISRTLNEDPAGRALYLAEAQVAVVHDTAVAGPTGPILGQRLRIDVEPSLGGRWFADMRIDVRRYLMPVRPVTIAVRVQHVGRCGPGASDSRLTPLVVGSADAGARLRPADVRARRMRVGCHRVLADRSARRRPVRPRERGCARAGARSAHGRSRLRQGAHRGHCLRRRRDPVDPPASGGDRAPAAPASAAARTLPASSSK